MLIWTAGHSGPNWELKDKASTLWYPSLPLHPWIFRYLMATAGRGRSSHEFLMNWLFHAHLFSCHETVEWKVPGWAGSHPHICGHPCRKTCPVSRKGRSSSISKLTHGREKASELAFLGDLFLLHWFIICFWVAGPFWKPGKCYGSSSPKLCVCQVLTPMHAHMHTYFLKPLGGVISSQGVLGIRIGCCIRSWGNSLLLSLKMWAILFKSPFKINECSVPASWKDLDNNDVTKSTAVSSLD